MTPIGAGSSPRQYSDVEYVFDAHSSTVTPLREYLVALWERRRFMVELAKADLKGPRSSTVLGRIWGVLDPLFQAAIYFFLFTVIRGGTGRSIDFLPVLIADIFLFGLSTAALNDGGRSIRKSKNLMLNSTFPRALLPIASIYKSLLAFVPSALVYAVVHLILGAPIGVGLSLLPLLFLLQTTMSVGIALLVATLVVYFRDAANLINYVTRVLFFTTPVIYPVAQIPSGLRPILIWQPLYPLFASYQKIFSGGVPSAGMIVLVAIWAVVLLAWGVTVFRRHERHFAVHL